MKRPDGKAPSRAELFILTRTRKDGKPVNEASSAVIVWLSTSKFTVSSSIPKFIRKYPIGFIFNCSRTLFSLQTQLRELGSQEQDACQNSTARDDIFSQVVGRDRNGRVRCCGLGPSPSDFVGGKPTEAEAMKMVSEANDEVRQMKERLVAMEQTCAQMAQQMATMMSMMSSMQKNSAVDNVPIVVGSLSKLLF